MYCIVVPSCREMSTSVLVAASLLVASTLLVQASNNYYVRPTKESLCPDNVTCHAFDYYLSRQEHYFTSGVTFNFLPGIHHVSRVYSGHSIVGLKFTKYMSLNGTNVTVTTTTQTESAWFTLYNSSQISFTGINIFVNGNESLCSPYILDLINVSDVQFSHMFLNSSCGSGLSIRNAQAGSVLLDSIEVKVNGCGVNITDGSIAIANSHFVGSYLSQLVYVNIAEPPAQEKYRIDIKHCEFHNGSLFAYIELDAAAVVLNIADIYSNGCDIQVYAVKGRKLDVLIDRATLTFGKSSGIFVAVPNFRGIYNISINHCSIFSHHDGAIRIHLGGNIHSQVLVENSVVKNNQAIPTVFPVTGMLIAGLPNCEPNGPVILKNVTFESNTYIPSASIDAVVTVLLYYVQRVTIVDCHFKNNTGTALYLEGSLFSANGTTVFSDNIAYDGAALFISGLSKVLVNNDTKIVFSNNTANHAGGAIYISNGNNDQVLFTFNEYAVQCFFSAVGPIYHSHVLIFDNNTARDGGDAIYGGELDLTQTTLYNGTTLKCIQAIEKFSEFENRDSTSLISSDPSRTCFCEHNASNCLEYTRNKTVHPGQTFSLSAYVVGQHFGPSKGTVYAQFLNKTSTVSFLPLQRSQTVTQYYCDSEHNILNYTIMTPQVAESGTLVLTAQDVYVSEYIDEPAIEEAIKDYREDNSSVPSALLQLPLYINITISECPAGFSLSSEGICECTYIFKSHSGRYKVTCDINTQTIRREYSVWVNASLSMASYSKHCPLSYCTTTEVSVNLTTADGAHKQCVDNHSGALCGQCQDGYSLAIGSSRCLPNCSNKFLSLLLPFAAAGVLLVVVIKYLNLTVTWGALSGLIFYANIIQTFKSVFLTPDQAGVRVFAAFIAWLNLDFGIETCFFAGLDMYSKTWLQFAFPLYIWTLAGGIILICKYSQRATRVFGNNAVQVLATLFLLSYNKILRTITMVYSAANIEHMDLSDHRKWTETVWAYDGHLKYFRSLHGILFAVSTIIFVFLWIPFTFCILLGQWLQRCNHLWGLRWIRRVRPLLEAYYGPFKDSHRYWVGVLLLARVVVLIPAADPFASPNTNMLTVILLCVLLLFFASAVGGVYKKYHLSILENTFFVNLIAFAALTLYLNSNGTQAIAVYIMIGLCFVQFLILVAIQFYSIFLRLLKKESYKALNGYENLDIQVSEDDIRE